MSEDSSKVEIWAEVVEEKIASGEGITCNEVVQYGKLLDAIVITKERMAALIAMEEKRMAYALLESIGGKAKGKTIFFPEQQNGPCYSVAAMPDKERQDLIERLTRKRDVIDEQIKNLKSHDTMGRLYDVDEEAASRTVSKRKDGTTGSVAAVAMM